MQSEQYIAHKRETEQGEPVIQSVLEHLEGCAELAQSFAAEFGSQEFAYLCGLLHDIGKYSDRFQRPLQSGK